MKALTISQPYASLIADGHKWIENRTWETRYRGCLAIHAGKGTQYLTKKELANVPHGCVIAIARLVDCIPRSSVIDKIESGRGNDIAFTTKRTWREILQHEHCEGPWLWMLADVQQLETPVACNGDQGLWEFDTDFTALKMLKPVGAGV